MTGYIITLTDTEKTAMEYIAFDVDDWITNKASDKPAPETPE